MTHGTNALLSDFKLEYTFQDDKLADLDRQLALLLSTPAGTMPLDREFGIQMNFVDKPPEVVKSLYTAEVTKKVPQFIPWVRVYETTWEYGEQGHIKPKVVITRA